MAPYKFSIIQISRLFHLLSIPANCGIFFKNNLTFTFCTFAHSFPADHIFCALHGPAQRIFTTTGIPPSPFLTVKESGTLNQAVCVRSSMVGVAPLPTGHRAFPPATLGQGCRPTPCKNKENKPHKVTRGCKKGMPMVHQQSPLPAFYMDPVWSVL